MFMKGKVQYRFVKEAILAKRVYDNGDAKKVLIVSVPNKRKSVRRAFVQEDLEGLVAEFLSIHWFLKGVCVTSLSKKVENLVGLTDYPVSLREVDKFYNIYLKQLKEE